MGRPRLSLLGALVSAASLAVASTLSTAFAATVTVTPLADGTVGGVVVAADVTVTITWSPPNEETRTYTTTSSVSSKSPT